jgi:hypothetical protein
MRSSHALTNAIETGLSDRADYSQVVKVYGKPEEGRERYSSGDFVALEKTAIIGNPDMKRACTSHVERQNGTLRQWCKRLTRLTYVFSKKKENLLAARRCWHEPRRPRDLVVHGR